MRPTRTLLTAFLLALALTPAATREPVAIAGTDTPTRSARPAPLGRRVVLKPDRIELIDKDGLRLGVMPFDGRDTTLGRVAATVAVSSRPTWVTEGRPGVFMLTATLVQAPGTRLTATAPAVREVRLAAPSRGIRARKASATFEGVKVLSWDPERSRPLRDPSAWRPAIVYDGGATLRLERVELGWLGTTRPDGNTGVTWAASSGAVVDSRFHHNAGGAEILRGARVSVLRNTIEDSAGHGLVVSESGAAPAVQRNLVRRNGGDGIVLAGVDGLLVWGNVVRGNRVGIRVARHSRRSRIETNLVEGNRVGIEVYDGARDTMLTRNAIAGSAETGMVLEGAASLSRADQVRETPVAVEVRGPARLEDTGVTGAVRGIVVGPRGNARIDRAQVASSAVALEISLGSVVRVHGSRLHAPSPIAGGSALEQAGNDLGPPPPPQPPPLPWLAFAGIAFLFLAVFLQVVHRARNQVQASGRGRSRCLADLE